jgi:hypothetical protein
MLEAKIAPPANFGFAIHEKTATANPIKSKCFTRHIVCNDATWRC